MASLGLVTKQTGAMARWTTPLLKRRSKVFNEADTLLNTADISDPDIVVDPSMKTDNPGATSVKHPMIPVPAAAAAGSFVFPLAPLPSTGAATSGAAGGGGARSPTDRRRQLFFPLGARPAAAALLLLLPLRLLTRPAAPSLVASPPKLFELDPTIFFIVHQLHGGTLEAA